MSKVIKEFFCVEEKKTFYVGDEYTGKRTDLSGYVEKKKTKVLKPEVKKKPNKSK